MKINRTIAENISANLFLRLITYGFSFLTVLFAARILQPEAYGKTAFVSSFTGYFVMLANLGMPIYAMRLCAEKKGDRKELSRAANELKTRLADAERKARVYETAEILHEPSEEIRAATTSRCMIS